MVYGLTIIMIDIFVSKELKIVNAEVGEELSGTKGKKFKHE